MKWTEKAWTGLEELNAMPVNCNVIQDAHRPPKEPAYLAIPAGDHRLSMAASISRRSGRSTEAEESVMVRCQRYWPGEARVARGAQPFAGHAAGNGRFEQKDFRLVLQEIGLVQMIRSG